MVKDNRAKKLLLFCEDCGEKNFCHYLEDNAQIVKKSIRFRCKACNYLNIYSFADCE